MSEQYSFDDKPKRKRDQDPTTWADAWKALGILAGVVLVYSLITNFASQLILGDTLARAGEISLELARVQTVGLDLSFLNTMSNAMMNPLFVLGAALVMSTILVLVLLIIYSLIHAVTNKFLGGEGTLRGLIVRANGWSLGIYLVYSIGVFLANLQFSSALVNRFDGATITTPLLIEYQTMASNFSLVANILLYGGWLVWSIAISMIVSRNYQISKGKGCLAMVISNVILGVVVCALAFAVGAAIFGTVAGPIPLAID